MYWTLVPGLNVMTSIRYESIDFKGGVRGSNDTPVILKGVGRLNWELYMKLSKINSRYLVITRTVSTSNGYYIADKSI